MDVLSSVEIVKALGLRTERRCWRARGISTDSRRIEEGELFVALSGERYDGHDFVRDAFGRGAVAAVVSRQVRLPEATADRPLLEVPDTREALGRLAAWYRRRWAGTVVAVTGSNGKTTTREMIHAALAGTMRVKRSPESFNNAVGVPLTIFQVSTDDQVLVVEMGTSAPGEIALLTDMAQPNVAVITNVAETHLAGLGDVAGVAKEKANVLGALGQTGTAVLNADDAWFGWLAAHHTGPVVTFGRCAKAMVCATNVRRAPPGFRFHATDGVEVTLRVPGEHNVANALAALAVAQALGADAASAAEGLGRFRLPPMRFTMHRSAGVLVINDAYNANLRSMQAAIRELNALHVAGRKIMVCGDMLELGPDSGRLHRMLGESIAQSRVDLLLAVGERAADVAEAAKADRRTRREVYHLPSVEQAAERIVGVVREGDAVLVKGSRGMRLERVVEALCRREPVAAN